MKLPGERPMNGQPKPAFYAAVVLVVAGLVAFAVWRSDIFAPAAKKQEASPIDPKELAGPKELDAQAEHPDAGPDLMAKEYKFRPRQERLPDPAGVGAYAPL